jgi:putative transposase
MANTYTQLSIHGVFAVKRRENLITKDFRDDVHKYMSGTIKNLGGKPLAVGGWLDHVHIFFGFPTTVSLSDFIQKVKINSSGWINEKGFLDRKFNWQDGYGAFSYARSQRDTVIKYIMNQEAHHKKQTLKKEYIKLLNNFEVDYNEKYLFEFFE